MTHRFLYKTCSTCYQDYHFIFPAFLPARADNVGGIGEAERFLQYPFVPLLGIVCDTLNIKSIAISLIYLHLNEREY
jgi:hypothetical protein